MAAASLDSKDNENCIGKTSPKEEEHSISLSRRNQHAISNAKITLIIKITKLHCPSFFPSHPSHSYTGKREGERGEEEWSHRTV